MVRKTYSIPLFILFSLFKTTTNCCYLKFSSYFIYFIYFTLAQLPLYQLVASLLYHKNAVYYHIFALIYHIFALSYHIIAANYHIFAPKYHKNALTITKMPLSYLDAIRVSQKCPQTITFLPSRNKCYHKLNYV
jgi:hypothetical protein